MVTVGVLAAAFTCALTIEVANAQSFNCRKASNEAERAICRSRGIAKMDRRSAALFHKIISQLAGDVADRMRDNQRAWLVARDACGADRGCLTRAYQTRIAAFSDLLAGRVPKGGLRIEQPTTTAVSCSGELASARSAASAVKVGFDIPASPTVGEAISVRWSGPQGNPTQVPVYLIFDAAAQVRFDGTNFLPLTVGARAPYGLKHALQRTRAFVPLVHGQAAAGGFKILPQRVGSQQIGWAIVSGGACGEVVLATGSPSSFTVGLGTPEIVIQDRFTTERPLKRIHHASGHYDLLVFKGRYEIHEADTDELLLERAGIDPNFSPTGRFVAARREVDHSFEVLDIVSGDLVATFSNGLLAWALNDSIVIHSGSDYGTAGYALTLGGDSGARPSGSLDFSSLGLGSTVLTNMPKPVRCWIDCEVILDIDAGYLAVIGTGQAAVSNLFTRKDQMLETGTSAAYAEKGVDPQSRSEGQSLIRSKFGSGLTIPSGRWNLGEPIKLSHREDNGYDVGNTQTRFLVEYPDIKNTVKVSSDTRSSGGLLRGMPPPNPRASHDIVSRIGVVFARISTTIGRPIEKPLPITREAFDDSDATAEARRKQRALRIADEVPSFRSKLKIDGKWSCEFANAEALNPGYITVVWSWSGRNGPVFLLRADCFSGSAVGQEGSLVLVAAGGNPATLNTTLFPQDKIDNNPLGSFGNDSSDIGAFPLNRGAFILSSSYSATAALIDEDTGNRIGAIIGLRDPNLLEALRVTSDRLFMVQLNRDGRFFISRLSDGELLLKGAYIDDEIVILTPDGRYDTSYEGAETLQVSFRGLGGLQTIHQFEKPLLRRGLAANILAGHAVAARPPSIGIPPTLKLEVDERPVRGKLHGRVAALSQSGLDRVHVYLDGRLVDDKAVGGSSGEVEFNTSDPGGGHWITAVAFDRDGLASRPQVVSLPPPVRPRGTMRAVLVGIGDYDDPEIPQLLTPSLDARSLSQALQASKSHLVSEVSTQLLIDGEATEDQILTAVSQAAATTGPDDTVVFFFAGHGLDAAKDDSPSQLVLALTSTDLDNLQTTALPWSKIASAISGARGKVVVILDACQAGLAGKESFATNDDLADLLLTRSSAPIILLAASKGRQSSGETPMGGRFTLAIDAALTRNRDNTDIDHNGIIDLRELYAAVKSAVVSEAHKYAVQTHKPESEQTPWLARNALVGKMALF